MTQKISMFVVMLATAVTVAGQPSADQPKAVAGFQAEVVRELDETAGKVISLAEAIPEEKYSWRPGEGVRSVKEVFGHIADANYLIPTYVGAALPYEGYTFGTSEQKEMTKAEVIQTLRDSFAHQKAAIQKVVAANLGNEVDWFGGSKNTVRGVMLFIPKHLGEHQGQLIAYARMNGIVPPWSRTEGR